MSLTIGYLLATVAAQAGSAYFNCKRSAKQAKELARKQQEFEERVLRDGIKNSRNEFDEVCSLQREIERQMQQDRVQLIRDNHHTTLMLEAYRHSLNNWPLFVPPFIIKNESLPLLEIKQIDGVETMAVNCILTPSIDNSFNLKVFPQLEEKLAHFFSKYWATNSIKAVRFYQKAWRNNIIDVGARIHDLKAHLSEVPTIVLSPIIDDNKLKFSFSWWGFSNNINDEHILELDNIYDPELSVDVLPQMSYSDELVKKILGESIPKIEAFISYFADLYYWNYYHLTPTLPSLLGKNVIELSNVSDFVKGYLNILSGSYLDYDKEDSRSLLSNNVDDSLAFGMALSIIIKGDYIHPFQSALLRAIGNTLPIKVDESTSFVDLITHSNLYLLLTHKQIDSLDKLYQLKDDTAKTDRPFVEIHDDKTTSKGKINSKYIMDHLTYIKKKDKLLSLLNGISKISKLPKGHSLQFERIMHKIQEDQFSVALIGEFQGGKSTTFDALCGGREISPRGNNIKTSSCRIEVTNIAYSGDEHAIVNWKSNVEIIQTISSILGSIDPLLLGYDASSKKNFSYAEYINLDNPKHMGLINDAIDHEISNVSGNEDGIKDVILIARFITAFYEKTKELRKIKDCSLVEASEIMTFPQDMMERYNKSNDDVSVFTPKEALFAFVQTINCYFHSKDLERLGCTVIDCPGLFASDYDTSIALDTIVSSDAVLYLLNGEKQYSQGDVKAVKKIFELGKLAQPNFKGDNIFFAINQRKPIEQTSFINLDLSMINETGFSKKHLPIYNALLYFYAQFGKNYLLNQIDENTIQRYLNSTKKKYLSVEEKWVKDISKILVSLDLDEEYDIHSLTSESVDVVNDIARSSSVFSEIEDYIVKEKAHSILIENGANKIINGLTSVEKILSEREAAARKDVQERANEYEVARAELRNFLQKSEKKLKDSFDDNDILRQFIDNVYGHYFINADLVSSISLETTKSLLDYVRKGKTKWNAICSKIGFTKKIRDNNEKKIRAEVEPFFAQSFKDAFSPVVEKWVKSMFANKDEEFKRVMLKEAKCLSTAIEDEWKIAVAETPILQNLTPIETTLDLAVCTERNATFSDKIGSDAINQTAKMAIEDIIAEIISQVVSIVIGTTVTFAMDALFTGGVAVFIGLVSSVLTYLGLRSPKEINSPEDLGKKGRQLFDMINSNIFSAMANGETREQVCFSEEGLISIARQLAQNFKDFYSHQLSSRADELEELIKKAEQEYNVTREKLEEIAMEAKEIRTKEVEPLREKVSEFKQGIENE
jgi:hypothetical protein